MFNKDKFNRIFMIYRKNTNIILKKWKEKITTYLKGCKKKISICLKTGKERIKPYLKSAKRRIDLFLEKYKVEVQNFVVAVVGISLTMSILAFAPKNVQNKGNVITTNKAEEYFYAGEYEKAIQEYNDISVKGKPSPWWDMKIAEVYSVKGELENSRKYIEKVKNVNSKEVELLNYITFTEFSNRDYGQALKDGEEALKIGPQNRSLLKTMFIVYMANNQLEKAKALITAYPADNRSAYDTAEYARMLMIVGDWEIGFKELKNAWQLNKDEIKIYDVLAQISVYNKTMLLQSVSSLSTKNPSEPMYKLWLAKIYSLSEETAEEADKILNSIQGADVGNIEPKLIKASILQNTKKADKAEELMNTIIKENSNDYRVLHAAGWYYLNKKEIDKAMEFCKKSIVKNKDYPDNYGFLMPEILKAKGKSLEGEPFFRTAMLKEPYNYNIMLTVANYYWYTTKNTEKALEYFKFAEIVKPMDPEIKYNMALIYLTNKKEDEAIKLLKECSKLSDNVPKYHRTLGTIYMVTGKTNEGIAQIREAYQGDQGDILTLNNAGCYYIMVDQNLERGLFNFQKAYEGIVPSTDSYTKDTITENYNKVKKLLEEYKNASDNQTLKIPEFTLFY